VSASPIRLLLLLALLALAAGCAARRPGPTRTIASKQARTARSAVTYRRLSPIAASATVLDDAVRAMGSCARIPIATTTSSSTVPTDAATDGDLTTVFNSGAFGPHTLTLDLAEPNVVSALVLATEQTPDGVTSHVIEISDDGAAWSELATLRGHTTTETVYAATVRRSPRARYVRIRTIDSPSWIAFRDVAVISCTGAARASGDPVPRRTPVDRTGWRWSRGEGSCTSARDCAYAECCGPTTCVARVDAPRCAGVGCGRMHSADIVECGCRASTCGAWITALGNLSVSPGSH
jgi:hypothetical protein